MSIDIFYMQKRERVTLTHTKQNRGIKQDAGKNIFAK